MNKFEPLVSIIVPIYNVEKYLYECVNSVINQSHTQLEIILVDDGSPDNSGKICDEFAEKDNRVKVIHQKNEGVSAARNAGIEIARGDYISFVDGDDTICPDFIEYLLNLIIKSNSDVAISTDCFRPFHMNQNVNDNTQIWMPEKSIEQYLLLRIGPIGCWNKMFKRSLLGKNMRFLTQLRMGEGLTFVIEAFGSANSVAVGHRKIYTYRKDNTESATTKFDTDRWIHALNTIERLKKSIPLKTNRIYQAIEYHTWVTYYIILKLIIDNHAEKNEYEMYKKCIDFSRYNALAMLKMPVAKQRKLQAIMCSVSPVLTVKINSVLRPQKS